jgi:hypothetical protein
MPHLTRARAVILILAVAVVLVVLYDLVVARLGIGSVMYGVRINSSLPIREARYQSHARVDYANEVAHHWQSTTIGLPVPPEGLDGERFEAHVTFTDRESGMGWRYSSFQYRYLVVVAVLADGRRVGKVVELPDARESREITVHLD